jgi:hypothetical protein
MLEPKGYRHSVTEIVVVPWPVDMNDGAPMGIAGPVGLRFEEPIELGDRGETVACEDARVAKEPCGENKIANEYSWK